MKIFAINGYWKDDKDSTFEEYLVSEFDECPDGYSDDDIFFYGMSEECIKDAINKKENTVHDFVITGYEEI